MKYLAALFLAAHGLIHASYLTPAPPATAGGPEWPFHMSRSWAVTAIGIDAGIVRAIGAALVVAVVIGFVLAALSWLGWVVPAEWWPALAGASSVASVLVLSLFFHPWILLGFAIDAVILWLVIGAGTTATVSP